MGFSLQAVDAQGRNREEYEYLSYNRRTWFKLVDLIKTSPAPPSDELGEILGSLSWNDGDLVTPGQCRWIAARLANVDHARIMAEEPEPEELLRLVDEVKAFCERCSERGGFEVW
jgi:hypothetical protein